MKDVRVGIIGYITPQTVNISNPSPDNVFTDIIEAVDAEAKKLRSVGVDIILAVGHAGYVLDQQLAAEVPDLDLVIGGHSHTFLYTGHSPPSSDQPSGAG